MSETRWNPRALGLLAATGLTAAALTAIPGAHAAPAPVAADPAASFAATASLATTLSDQLGDQSAGSYLDSSGKLVVAVTDNATATKVKASGAVPRMVANSGAQLKAATAELGASARIPGTAWAIDPRTNQVVVSADETVTGAKLDQLTATVATLGGAARLEHTAGTLRPTITGGDAIHAGGIRCSLGFNVRKGNTYYVLTAGHCTNAAANWTGTGGRSIGPRTGSSFPGNDYGIIQYTASGWQRPGAVNLYNGQRRDITAAATPAVGQSVSRSGSTTGLRSGTVTALNATVNYPEGSVTGLIRTTVCAEPGDSGGSLFSGNTALGLTSGGSGNCRSGGVTYFQPVTEALSVYGVTVY